MQKLDSTRTALAACAILFLTGAGAGIDYYQMREIIYDLRKGQDSETYWRLKPKVESGRADISQISIWCEAAMRLNYPCELKGVQPSAGAILWFSGSGGYSYIDERDLIWWRNTSRQYQAWARSGSRRPFILSRDRRKDAYLKDKYCKIGAKVSSRYSHYTKRPIRFTCPFGHRG